MSQLTVGVLALQGDFREHLASLSACGVNAIKVRSIADLDKVSGLVFPGGESTTIDKLIRIYELQAPIRERIADGMPCYGSCAGMIMLADRLSNPHTGQQTIGGFDITVRRNAFGRQVESFEEDLTINGIDDGPVSAVFIRAPWVDSVGPDVEVLARSSVTGNPIVAVRQGNLLATSFHPEVTGDHRVHAYFVEMCRTTIGKTAEVAA